MHQSKLAFVRVTADDAAQQRQAVFAATRPTAALAPAAAPEKRGPGRPRKMKLTAPPDEQPRSKQRTGSYTHWFASPYINDVLRAVTQSGFAWRRAVEQLKLRAPDDRFVHLSDSTVRDWYDKEHKLKPQFQAQLEARKPHAGGRPALLCSDIEDEVKRVLLQLREAGTPINSHVIRWTMQGIFAERDPSLLDSLRLSQQWISQWVRAKLQWTWRARTTAASKLPHDWAEQGVLMAKRIAAKMEMHGVRVLRMRCCRVRYDAR